jgi:segregation and condensation protein A
VRARSEPVVHIVSRRAVMTLDEALARLERMVGARVGWDRLDAFLPDTQDPAYRKSALASSFVATLELARLGKIEVAQDGAFAPLMVRGA